MITHLLNSFLIGILFVDMLERRFPIKFQNFMITLSYNSIYYFSKLQIFFVKAKTNINTFIENNPSLLKIKQQLDLLLSKPETRQSTRYFVKNNKLHRLCDLNDIEPDFMILSWLSDDKKCANKKIIYNYNKEDDLLMIDSSDIKFLLIEFKVGDNRTYKIDLKTEYYNYYIIGNKFTKDFFIFYITHYLSQFNNDIKDTDKCSLKLIDHDVNTINLDFTDKNDSILLEKNGYKLSITNHIKE
jgi:hypothetical protein